MVTRLRAPGGAAVDGDLTAIDRGEGLRVAGVLRETPPSSRLPGRLAAERAVTRDVQRAEWRTLGGLVGLRGSFLLSTPPNNIGPTWIIDTRQAALAARALIDQAHGAQPQSAAAVLDEWLAPFRERP